MNFFYTVRLCACVLAFAGTLTACNGGSTSSGMSPIPSVDNSTTTGTQDAAAQSSSSGSASMQASATTGVPQHIPVWAYDENYSQGENASESQVRAYLTYAEGGYGNSKAYYDCAGSGTCYSVFYVNPNLQYGSTVCPDSGSSPFVAASAEAWFVHLKGYTDKAHRVHGTYSASCKAGSQSAPVWVANGANAGVQAYYNTYLQKYANTWNYYFMDSTAGTVVDQMYGPGGSFCGGALCTATQELPTNAAVVSSHAALVNALTHSTGAPMQFFYNGLSFDGAQNANDFTILQSSNRFVGAACENCVVNQNTLVPKMYAPVLNAMATVDNLPSGAFVLLSSGNAPAGSSSQVVQRLVTTAVIWLGYKDGHTVVWPDLEYNTNNLAVWPEDQIYPSQPLQSMTTGASNLQVATNVWRREFGACYNKGVSIGACAAILNGTSSAVVVKSSWLQKTYVHSVLLSGGDILSGGSVGLKSTAFTANSTSIPAGQALLLVP